MDEKDQLIRVLSKASDKWGNPHLTGFMDHYNLNGLQFGTVSQFQEYIKNHKLGGLQYG